MKQRYESWVHGNSVLLERLGSPNANSKASALGAYGGHMGDLLGTGDMGGAACFRLGWAARFVMVDLGNGNANKSANFWVHYAIPTPAVQSAERSLARKVMVNYESNDGDRLTMSISRMHVWDGNRKIFADDVVKRSRNDFNGGLAGTGTSRSSLVPTQVLSGNLGDQPIFFGLGVSLLISANTARDKYLEIRGVGVEFVGEDRT